MSRANVTRQELPRMGSEYSDEVSKINKKEDIMLERKIRFLERQEKISQSLLKKNKNEIERLKASISNNSYRSTDLTQYDQLKAHDRANSHHTTTRSGGVTWRDSSSVRLPPLWNEKTGTMLVSQSPEINDNYFEMPSSGSSSRRRRLCNHTRSNSNRALSLRELKDPAGPILSSSFNGSI